MVNPARIDEILSDLDELDFYPSDPRKRLRILREVCEMADDEDQVRWLVRRMTSGIYEKWHSVRELRACFTSRYKPKDGIEATSAIYAEGFPPDPEVEAKKKEIATRARAALPSAPEEVREEIRETLRIAMGGHP